MNRAPFARVAFAAPALALIGALAVACFVKVYGAVFLGTARSEHARARARIAAEHARADGRAGRLLLPDRAGAVAGCARSSNMAISAWAPELGDAGPRLATLAPLDWITIMGLLLIAVLLAGGGLLLRSGGETAHRPRASTWGCGYAAPTPRMQYTSSSFAQMLVGLFGWVLRPRTHKPSDLPLFPQTSRVSQRGARRGARRGRAAGVSLRARLAVLWFRVFQQGNIQTLLAVHLPRPDCPAALALEGTR